MNNYRGITIQNILCKIYETVLSNRSSTVIKKAVNIVQTQSACEKGLSSLHGSLCFQETVAHCADNDSNVFATYFDARKAFDTVWIEGLLYILYKCGIKGKLWRLIYLSYINCYSAVLVNGKLSNWLKLLQGVKQGAILSMLLYICFINGLLNELLISNLGCTVLDLNVGAIGYADDIVIVSLDVKSLQQMVNLAYRYSCKWRF